MPKVDNTRMEAKMVEQGTAEAMMFADYVLTIGYRIPDGFVGEITVRECIGKSTQVLLNGVLVYTRPSLDADESLFLLRVKKSDNPNWPVGSYYREKGSFGKCEAVVFGRGDVYCNRVFVPDLLIKRVEFEVVEFVEKVADVAKNPTVDPGRERAVAGIDRGVVRRCDDCGANYLITKGDRHGGQKTVCRDRDACHRRSGG